ncbi:hypothetical protein TEA_005813 [Camellia sinensis var. sinensis]|uniref:3,4-dihydroxy-2-butanone-4-phosphate synthase n=1 Tax=Camellia sinensis var. sinensis TaxID=542762 RepID=A0A4S4EWE7_CAMSN|nr:hypothetical protein TEA_005813 [Camellia sinensis var. sinensis]
MMWVFYLISMPLTLGMVLLTLKYFAGPYVPRYVLFTVGYTWFCSLSIIILVPADIWTEDHKQQEPSRRDKLMTQAISSLGVEWCDRWNDGRSSRVARVFKLITETEPSVYLWAYILDCCMFYELEQPAETEKTTTVRNGDFNLGATKEVLDWIGKPAGIEIQPDAIAFGTLGAETTPATFGFPIDNDEFVLDYPTKAFSSIPEAIEDIRQGKMVVVVDDEDRENEGDLIMAASMVTPEAMACFVKHGTGIVCVSMKGEDLERLELPLMVARKDNEEKLCTAFTVSVFLASMVTPEAMAFFVKHGTGIVCVSMKGEDLERLELPLMVARKDNEEKLCTAFTVSVDAKECTTTGVSAHDRATTILALASKDSKPEDFNRPGHIFPLKYREGGVLKRAGHTEASVDLAMLAGLDPVAVLCEIVNDDGSMTRLQNASAICAVT